MNPNDIPMEAMQEDQISPEDQAAMDENVKALAESILTTRNEAVAHRASSGIERTWREAQRAFDGVDNTVGRADMMDYATGDAWGTKTPEQNKRSKVIVNIIRGKCETAEGRFTEIQMPSDDRNWGLLNTKVPDAVMVPKEDVGMVQPAPQQGVDQMGQPQPQPQPAQPPAPINERQAKKDDLEKRRAAMEEEIDDQLGECHFNGESRKVAKQAIRLGTGVLKGPSVMKSLRKAWTSQVDSTGETYVLQVLEEMKPVSKWVDVWNCFPDPNCGSDVKRGAFMWEKDYILAREVRGLIGAPGYDNRQLGLVLEELPKRTNVQFDKGIQNQRTQTTTITKGAPYERWEYNGEITQEEMSALGCDCEGEPGEAVSVCIVFINDRPVKVVQNMLDNGELPYDFFQWVQNDDDSPWGMGEPMKIIWQQRIITAAWRAMMDNAGASSGPTIIMSNKVVPEDDIWTIGGSKIWIDDSEDGDVSKAFAQFQITNNQAELQRIIELALKFTDLESGIPALAQGERGSSPETLGGMKMLMDGADTTRRRQVKQWDDQITHPHIGRYYHWNMQYNPKNEIKGDFEVDARGTSVLLVKDQTAQSLMQILSLRADPEVNLQVDWGKCIRQLFQARHLDVLKPEEQVEEDRKHIQPQKDVRLQVEELRAKEAADHAVAQAHLEINQQNFDAKEAEKDRQLQILVRHSDEYIEQMKQSGASAETVAQLKAMLAATSMKLAVQKDLSLAGHIADIHKHRNPSPQIMTPPSEPAGRAANGQAYQA